MQWLRFYQAVPCVRLESNLQLRRSTGHAVGSKTWIAFHWQHVLSYLVKSRSRAICVYNCAILLEFDRRLGSTAAGGRLERMRGVLWCKVCWTGLLLPLRAYILNTSPPSAVYMRRWTGSDNGLSSGRRQAIIWTNAWILSIGPLWTNVSEIGIEIQNFSFMKMHLKMSCATRFHDSGPVWTHYVLSTRGPFY